MSKTDIIYLKIWCDNVTFCQRGLFFLLTLYMHSSQNFRAIGPLFMEILLFEYLGDTSVNSECSLGVNLVFEIVLCSFRFFTSI